MSKTRIAYLIVCACFVVSCSDSREKNSDKTELPEIHLSISDELNLGDYSSGKIKAYDTSGKRTLKGKVKIRYRGNRSYEYPKKSYSLKFKKREPLLGLPKNSRWKLNAEYIDKTLIRNKLSYDLFREFSGENMAPQVRFVNVYTNKKYAGIYALTQTVDENNLRIKKGQGAVLFKEPPICHSPDEHEERFANFKNYSKISIRYSAFSEKARKKLIEHSYYNQRYPSLKKEDYSFAIVALTEFIFNSSDNDFCDANEFGKFFDLDNLIDWHLLILVTNNGDGFYKNFYLYRKNAQSPFLFVPWDYDHSFGREGDGELAREKITDLSKMPLIQRLLETNAFNYREKLYNRFIELKNKGVLTEKHIHNMIDANVEILKPAIKNNVRRWPISHSKYFKKASFESEVDLMKDWIGPHLKDLETYLKSLKGIESTDALNSPEIRSTVVASGIHSGNLPMPNEILIRTTSAVDPDYLPVMVREDTIQNRKSPR